MSDTPKLITVDDLKEFRETHMKGPLQHHEEIVEFLNVALSNVGDKDQVVFAEIGILKGGNFVFIGDILNKFFDNVYGIGIDLPNIKEFAGEDVDPTEEVSKLEPTFSYDLIIGNSTHKETIDKTSELLNGRKIDLLFIDGDHNYKGCMADFNNYSPMVRDGGVIGFHDLGERRFDVRTKVWPEIKKQYSQNWEFVRKPGHYGIGVIIKDK